MNRTIGEVPFQVKNVFDLRELKGCLAHKAFDSSKTRGRRDPRDPLGDPFLIDAGSLLECKAMRRLAHKTQVFPSPNNPHVRTRKIHTDEVLSTSMILGDLLGLNQNLLMAIALGHDIGHAPYGHLGEDVIAEVTGREFDHAVFGVVAAQEIERRGRGLNLCYETLLGIRYHSCKDTEHNPDWPEEVALVPHCDAICWAFSDVEDIIRNGIKTESEFPIILRDFGANHRERVTTCYGALVTESAEMGYVSFSKSDIAIKFREFRIWLYDNVYRRFDRKLHAFVLKETFKLFERLFDVRCGPAVLLALLTDREALEMCGLIHSCDRITLDDLRKLDFGLFEILPYIEGKQFSIDKADLSWVGKG